MSDEHVQGTGDGAYRSGDAEGSALAARRHGSCAPLPQIPYGPHEDLASAQIAPVDREAEALGAAFAAAGLDAPPVFDPAVEVGRGGEE